MISSYCDQSILKLAQEKGLIEIHTHNPRDFSADKHKCVDDTPYGGGAGMLLSPQPFYESMIDLVSIMRSKQSGKVTELANLGDLDLDQLNLGTLNHPEKRNYEVIMLSPSGRTFNQEIAKELSGKDNLVFLCGRYEGFDERIKNLATLEISMGDYILTGGELGALAIIDSISRLLPGVLGDEASSECESFESKNYLADESLKTLSKRELQELLDELRGLDPDGDFFNKVQSLDDLKSFLEELKLLEHPHYTRPADFRGQKIPEVLQSGDHKQIMLWRLKEAIKKTKELRPDLLSK